MQRRLAILNDTIIRQEQSHDREGVFTVNARAFDTDLEAKLADALRTASIPYLSLVAVWNREIIGHILFSPVTVSHNPQQVVAYGLAPMAVLPEYQRQGVGAKLLQAGLDCCRETGVDLIFVLGHGDYYPRFGFQPVSRYGLHYGAPSTEQNIDEYFFVLELNPGSLDRVSGNVSYLPLFTNMG